MSETITLRLPEGTKAELQRRGLKPNRWIAGLVSSQLKKDQPDPLLRFAGIVKGGPADLSYNKKYRRAWGKKPR